MFSRCPNIGSPNPHWPARFDVAESIPVQTRTRPSKRASPWSVQKWNSPQGEQVHYTDGAAGHQITAGDLQFSNFDD